MNAETPSIATRAALYLRVSTTRQAEHDVSIPDQKRQGEAYCLSRGYQLIDTYVEPGASATNDRRPEFQRMIEAGTSKPAPFDIVVVHSFSRFLRDHFELEFYVRKLAKNGVKLVSITQEMGDDPMHVMMRQIMALFDEYQSKENGKHVMRALKENARQGFWNGALPPIGYRIVAAEQRGAKTKKKLEIDPLHADTVRLIYRLALEGNGTSGPMGVKAIVSHLNARRIFTRDGGRWGIGQLHRILTRRTYIGEHEFNKRSKTKELKPVSEIVTVPVPPLIDLETFDAVQAHLRARNPKVTPPRVVSGPTLLTGICFCAKCGGAMTIRTGKGGRYRYYTCSIKARQGETGCSGRSIPMEKLDTIVASHVEDRLLQPDRLEEVLASILDRRSERAERRQEHIGELNRRAAETDLRLKRLYDAIESGVADLSDPALKDRIVGLKALRDQAQVDAERAQAMLESSGNQAVTPATVRRFADVARQRIRLDGGGYRRDHLRAFAQRVEVGEAEVRIMGSKGELLRTLSAVSSGKSAGIGVPSLGLKWRSRCPPNSYAAKFHAVSFHQQILAVNRLACIRLLQSISFCPTIIGGTNGGTDMPKLSVKSIAALKQPGMYSDDDTPGFYLRIGPTGAKSWILRTLVHGKRREMGLGSVNVVGLAEARDLARAHRKSARQGGDPLAERKHAKGIPTFHDAAKAVHEALLPTWRNRKHAEAWLTTIETYAVPKIGVRSIDTISSGDVLEILSPVWTSKPETARRLKQRLGTVMDWAKGKGYLTSGNPVMGIEKALPRVERTQVHMAALSWRDLPEFMTDLASREGMSARCLEFIILTAARSGEARGARWEEIDFAAKVWTVPAERMKHKKPHRVPLSEAALAALEAVKGMDAVYCFPSPQRSHTAGGKPLSDMVFKSLFARMDRNGFVTHGFRSSFRDWASESAHAPREVAEACLSHATGNAVEQSYARSDLLERRRGLMDAWGRYATGAAGQVVELVRA